MCSLHEFDNQMAESNSRFHSNTWLYDRDCLLNTKQQKKEVLQEALLEIRPRLLLKIEECLTKINEFYCLNTSDQSVYTGSAGIALLHFHLAQHLYNADPDKKRAHLIQSLSFLTPSLTNLNTHHYTYLNGSPGPLSIATVVYISLGRNTEGMECIQRLISLYQSQKDEFQQIPCEVLYGCPGYLYSLLFVNAFVKDAISMDLIEEIRGLLVLRGQRGCDPSIQSPLMYTWHNKHYLGAAHGLAGIMTSLLQDATSSTVVSSHLSIIQQTIDYILSLQFPSMNFPSSLESSDRDRLVQWCHGAPGFVYLWSTAYKVFGDSKYLKAAKDCGEVVWERGLIKKGCGGLCHGVAGNGYTFLELYKLTNDCCYLYRAIKFAEWCLTNDQCHSDSPFSLFEGIAGTIYYLVEMCRVDTESAWFPGLQLPLYL